MPTPYPLPDPTLRALPPATLAEVGIRTARAVYGVELDYSRDGLARLDRMVGTELRVGRYRAEDFPADLACALAAYVGETLHRLAPSSRWGVPADDLYGTPLPFLIFIRADHERQVNVVADIMAFLWSGNGLSPLHYALRQLDDLTRLGFLEG